MAHYVTQGNFRSPSPGPLRSPTSVASLCRWSGSSGRRGRRDRSRPSRSGLARGFRLVARFLGRRTSLDYEIVEYDRERADLVPRSENGSVRSVETMTFEGDRGRSWS